MSKKERISEDLHFYFAMILYKELLRSNESRMGVSWFRLDALNVGGHAEDDRWPRKNSIKQITANESTHSRCLSCSDVSSLTGC